MMYKKLLTLSLFFFTLTAAVFFLPKVTFASDVYDARTAVILMTFQDSITPTLTPSEMSGIMFTNPDSVNSYYSANSYGKVTVTGDVLGWYQIPYTKPTDGSCDKASWMSAADQIATSQGVDLSTYKNRIYIWPDDIPNCGLADTANNVITVNSEYWARSEHVIVHEFGHLVSPRVDDPTKVGVNHTNFYRCGNKSIDFICQSAEYGDRYSRMGAPNLFNFIGLHKLALGWISSSALQTVSTDGIYTIDTLRASASGAMILKLAKPDDPTQSYYLEYRRDIRFDPALPDSYPIDLTKMENGVTIRLWNGDAATQTQLLDTTPQTPTPTDGNSGVNSDEALSDGASFHDDRNNITITQLSHTDDSATVKIEHGTPPCALAGPFSAEYFSNETLSGTPAVLQNDPCVRFDWTYPSPMAGLPWGFSARWIRQETLTGGTYTFDLRHDDGMRVYVDNTLVHDHWTGNSGNRETFTTGISQGVHTMKVEYFNYGAFCCGAVADVDWTLLAPDTTSPTVAITNPTNNADVSRNSTVTIAANASDNIVVSKVEFYVNGLLLCTDTASSYTCGWTVPGGKKQSYTLEAKAYDSNGNTSTDTIIVNSK